MWNALLASGASAFWEIEDQFLAAMTAFDREVAAGRSDQGDRQNGKGDFFDNVCSLVLERYSGKQLYVRPDVPGYSFERHKLDSAYPESGDVRLIIETKAVGIPKHPGSRAQKAAGRRGSADLPKRVKEAALKNIDIKAEAARRRKQPGAVSDLQTWLKGTEPYSYLLIAARATSESDRLAILRDCRVAGHWFAGVGLFVYGSDPASGDYAKLPVEDKAMRLDETLSRIATQLSEM